MQTHARHATSRQLQSCWLPHQQALQTRQCRSKTAARPETLLGQVASVSLPHSVKDHRRVRCRSYAQQATPSGVSIGSAWQGPPVLVVGAGIAGLATALALHRVGIPVQVYEAAGEGLRVVEGAAIGLWENAWKALDSLGVGDDLRETAMQLDRVELVTAEGRTLTSFRFQDTDAGAPSTTSIAGDGQDRQTEASSEFRGVRRANLLATLAERLPAGTVRTGARVVRVEVRGDGRKAWPQAVLDDGTKVEAAVVVGADGVRSVVAGPQGLKLPSTSYAGYTAYRGVATLPNGISSIKLPPNTIRQIWGRGLRAGLYPINDNEVYWYTCFNAPKDAPIPPTADDRQREAMMQMSGWAWDMYTVIRATPPTGITWSRIVDRWTKGTYGQGLVTLCGDAAHPMTPNLGQGGCTALEDAVVLARTLAGAVQGSTGGFQPQLETALREFETERSSRCLPLTVRANIMGLLLQLPFAPVIWFRDWFVSHLFRPSHFLDHTTYDCGILPGPITHASASFHAAATASTTGSSSTSANTSTASEGVEDEAVARVNR